MSRNEDPTASAPSAVNMADVARRAGVSIATVSRALRDVPGVSDATRSRIREVAEELAYVVSPEASSLARGETGRVAVVVPRLDVWFYSAMLAGLETVLRGAGMDVLVYQVDGEAHRSAFFRDLPARRKVDAVVLIALPLLPSEIDRLDLMGVHVVVAGGRIRDLPHVEVDDLSVARTAVDHLVGLGHIRVAMIRTSDTDGTTWSSDVLRVRGYRESLTAHGIAVDDALLVTEPYAADAGARAMERLLALDERPTAVFCYSDEIAVSALAALWRAGLRVPGDISLIGVDGHPQAQAFGLSTVSQMVTVQARTAGELAVKLLRGQPVDPSVEVSAELVDRGSTAPPG